MISRKGVKFLLSIFLLQIFALSILFFNSNIVNAADVKFKPQITIPGSEFKAGDSVSVGGATGSTDTIAKYIRAVYQYGIGIVGILAAVVLMFGGLLWLTAGGDQGRVTEAKEWIKAALLGLVLALASFILLQTINPDLVEFKPITVTPITVKKIPSPVIEDDTSRPVAEPCPTPIFRPDPNPTPHPPISPQPILTIPPRCIPDVPPPTPLPPPPTPTPTPTPTP